MPPAPSASFAPRPFVLLRHARPGHPDHLDWLLATDPDGVGPLLSWRLPAAPERLRPPAGASVTAFAARASAHRAHYLTFEGSIGGDRGAVARVARGTWRTHASDQRAWTIDLDWGDGESTRATITFGGTEDASAPRDLPRHAHEPIDRLDCVGLPRD